MLRNVGQLHFLGPLHLRRRMRVHACVCVCVCVRARVRVHGSTRCVSAYMRPSVCVHIKCVRKMCAYMCICAHMCMRAYVSTHSKQPEHQHHHLLSHTLTSHPPSLSLARASAHTFDHILSLPPPKTHTNNTHTHSLSLSLSLSLSTLTSGATPRETSQMC